MISVEDSSDSETREAAALILSMSATRVSDFINRKRTERRLARLVRSLNEMTRGSTADRELALGALERMGLKLGG